MSIYDGIPLATLSARLAEAQDALHQINVGTKTVSLNVSGKQVAFTATSADKLRAYIRELQTAIAVSSGSAAAARPYSVATWTR